MSARTYIAIDLKSFYASVECVERGLDPLTTHLVVADKSRTEKTICLAVTPALKAYGVPGRARLFEANQHVRNINFDRMKRNHGKPFRAYSSDEVELKRDPTLGLSPIIAPPQMARYMDVSRQIYSIYLQYIAPEDIHVYSIDEVFIDVTPYLKMNRCSARQLAERMIHDVLTQTGITATVGIAPNLYLCKIAMDIDAKHQKADENGARIAELDEYSYRERLWNHKPLTDFWRIGKGIARKLESNGMYTMGDVARRSLTDEKWLYHLFGINAELLIDHAWGWEPCTMEDIKNYHTSDHSLSSGQVLSEPYPFDKARLVIREMTDLLVLDLVDKGLCTDQIVLTVGYDIENIQNTLIASRYQGEIVKDHYGRSIPKNAHGSIRLSGFTTSTKEILKATETLFDRIVDRDLLVRRMYVVANHVIPEEDAEKKVLPVQFNLFEAPQQQLAREEQLQKNLKRERNMQKALIEIRKKYGKNAILKGMNFEEGATSIMRNQQVGGHKA